ncbi:hypothetical protein [Nodosilinea nodulosa]|uniref:hypothetical protein n=1 Tax=Nodosilinea nodulosa TaxID=416001 RepID=UPI00030A8623|nr:hypothetical protein [Nodosilinea nodulosa]
MTPEQLELKQLLDANPIAWVSLTADQQSLLRETLRPDGPFTSEQQELLRNHWLPVSEDQVAQMRALLSGPMNIAPITDINGELWLSADLLTDCMESTDNYYAIASILVFLPITLKPSTDFPSPEEL